ncbi:MAG: Zn-dependent hydrolase [Candidatus Rokubacteria bacterium]|nr:Zn-dependent hydrolase [Candidatus Rokubacteria bacterium]
MLAISIARLRADIEALAGFGRTSSGGVTRPAWSPAHEEARAWLLGRMREAGLTTWIDPAGNTFGSSASGGAADSPDLGVLTGSHIDSVPDGGILDGALGVLAGLECLRTVREARPELARPLTLVAWSDEEGRYGSLFGSKAFTGKLDPAQLPALAAPDGERLVDAMARAGFNALDAPRAARDPKSVAGYVELHIEQGPHLEALGIPIGVVTGIVGITRNRIVFVGEPDHAGTTPMERRKDSFLAAADYALKAREVVVKRGSGRSVTNFGVVEVRPGVPNIVPARTSLLQEMRELDAAILERVERRCISLARRIARRRGITVEVLPVSRNEAAQCAPRVRAAVESACRALGLAFQRMPSGAGHDAQNLATVTEAGMIFIPSKGGRSHRPDEASDWEDIERGANVLLHTLLALAA